MSASRRQIEFALDVLQGMPSPALVRNLESILMTQPQVDVQTQHLVHAGMYARTIFVPAGTALTGAQTKLANVSIVSGDITVTTDSGPQRLTGYHVLPADSGFKRAGFAHDDTWWTTLWPTEKTDIEAIEDEMTDEAALLQTRNLAIGHAPAAMIEEG